MPSIAPLAAFARTYSNYRYVDLRGAIGKNQWRDELHPTAAGAAKTAARFDSALRKLPKSDAFASPLIASRAIVQTGGMTRYSGGHPARPATSFGVRAGIEP